MQAVYISNILCLQSARAPLLICYKEILEKAYE